MSPVRPVGKKADGVLGDISSNAAHRLREMMIPFHSTLSGHTEILYSVLGHPTKKEKTSISWSKFSRRMLRWSETGALAL